MAVTELTNWGAVGMQSGIKNDLALHEMNKRDVEMRANNLTAQIQQAMASNNWDLVADLRDRYHAVAFNPDTFEKKVVWKKDQYGNMRQFALDQVKQGDAQTWNNDNTQMTFQEAKDYGPSAEITLPFGVGILPSQNPMGLNPGAGYAVGAGKIGGTPAVTYTGAGPTITSYNPITSKIQPNQPGLTNSYKPSMPPKRYFVR